MRDGARPLAGVMVIDFGQLTAGANTAAMLADVGADVIKIESPANLDLFRTIGAPDNAPGWWNRSPPFKFSNRNKRSVALDLKSEEGRRLARELILKSDVMVENFRRGVLERLGLAYSDLCGANPRLVMASISSQGETGPYRTHASFGSTLDATGGLASLTGYAGEGPLVSGADVNYPDQVVSLIATGLILAALRQVRRTGQGAVLDISQREIVGYLIGEELVSAGADLSRRASRVGNAEADWLLQDCFRAGDGRWLALTVTDQLQAERVASLIGAPGSLRAGLTQWCGQRGAAEASRTLSQAGLACALVLDGLDLLHAPALSGQTLAADARGDLVKGMPYVFASRDFKIERVAPDLGEHTAQVLSDLLGLAPGDIARLQALGVTRTDPDN